VEWNYQPVSREQAVIGKGYGGPITTGVNEAVEPLLDSHQGGKTAGGKIIASIIPTKERATTAKKNAERGRRGIIKSPKTTDRSHGGGNRTTVSLRRGSRPVGGGERRQNPPKPHTKTTPEASRKIRCRGDAARW